MRWFKRLKVKQKIAASTFLVILFVTTVSWLSVQWIVFPNLTHEITSRGLTIAKSIVNRGQRYITADNQQDLLDVLFTEKWMEPNLVYIFIVDASGYVVAHTFLKPFPRSLIGINPLPPEQTQNTRLVFTSFGSVYDTALGIYEGIHRIGTVRVGLSKRSIDQVMHPLMNTLLVVLFLVIAIAIYLTTWFSRQITGPILKLSEVADEVSHGNLQTYTGLGKTVECWRLRECDLKECPAYERGKPPCWLGAHASLSRPEPDQEGQAQPESCEKCEVYRGMAGDEIEHLADAFCHMVYKLDLAQKELKRTNDDLRRLNRSYMEMLSFVSHELKSPIANSSMSAHALLQRIFGDLTPTQEKMVGLICRNLDQSVEMIKNYLDLSRIEKQELHFQPRLLRLRQEVVEPVLTDLSTLIATQKMRVENSMSDKIVLEADVELLKVVYRNLVGNACKYGREEGAVRLKADDLGPVYRLEVWNQGPGVPRDKMDQLFHKFSRIQHPRAAMAKGTGLGLFICRTIVEQHGGRMWAEASEGEWISFIIDLPKSQERSATDGPEENPHD
jgi:signal transduction histidine kinase